MKGRVSLFLLFASTGVAILTGLFAGIEGKTVLGCWFAFQMFIVAIIALTDKGCDEWEELDTQL